ncbi:hypothetical protein ATO6_13055 [Oceanicola sp. 22II-s10i]|uniref:hypothetical protein n=1 Tax=Oceanicola sp. 22II-s10i TaxID=1317116 RepID=UPI000B528607|nr:hypothetical protein [Oceanicola sp. 22II-s10i]OWU84590.1 hypothetical protein ATO6_13055 [Oceanicola sp. 22II-s10i]
MKTILTGALSAICMTIAATGVTAQTLQPPQQQQPGTMSPAGTWYCEMGFQNTAPGVNPNPVMMQFQMMLYQNGGAQGQGVQGASSGQFQFQFQGRWSAQGQMVVVEGQQSGGLAFGPSQFFFQSKMQSNQNMAFTHRYQNQQMQVYASQCVRQA